MIRNESIRSGTWYFDFKDVRYIYIVNWYANNNQSRMDVQLNSKNIEYSTATVYNEYAVFKYDDNALYLLRKGSSTNRCTCQQVYITYDMIPPTPPE